MPSSRVKMISLSAAISRFNAADVSMVGSRDGAHVARCPLNNVLLRIMFSAHLFWSGTTGTTSGGVSTDGTAPEAT